MNPTIATLLYKLYNAGYRVVIAEIDHTAFVVNVEKFDFEGDVTFIHQFSLALDATDEDFRQELVNISFVFESEIEDAETP